MALKLRAADEDRVFMNTLLYGPPGTGKTTGAASAPGGTLYLNVDLANATRSARRRNSGLMEVRYEGLQTLLDIVQAVTSNDGRIDTVVVDPIGELYRRLLMEASGCAARPTLQQYGDTSTHVERFVRSLCEFDVNVVIVAHETISKDESTGFHERLPFTGTGNPALGAKIMGMVDVIGYTGAVETDGVTKYVAQLVPTEGRRGKDRFDVLGAWREVNLSEWYDLAGVAEPRTPAVSDGKTDNENDADGVEKE